MPTPTAELAALTLELQRRGVIDVKFSWRPGAVEGLPASECMKGAADFIAEYLALQEPTLPTRRMLEDAGDIARLQAENEALRERDFEAGWRTAANWMNRDDLVSDIGSPAYIADRDSALKAPMTTSTDDRFGVYFPVEWRFEDENSKPGDGSGGPPVDDAGTVYVYQEDDYAITVLQRTTLTEMVESTLEVWGAGPGRQERMGPEFAPAAQALSASLRAAADLLDAWLPPDTVKDRSCPPQQMT